MRVRVSSLTPPRSLSTISIPRLMARPLARIVYSSTYDSSRRESGLLDRWSPWAPFTGVVFAVLFVASSVIAAITNSPSSDASGASVISFYQSHGTAMRIDAILFAFALIFLLFFTGSLRAYLRRAPHVDGLASLMPVAAAVLLVGETVVDGIGYALADVPNHLNPAAAQALNVLNNDLIITKTAGLCALGISSGLAILRARLLPRWLGWLAIAMGIIVLTPAELLAFIALIVWAVVASILIWTRSRKPTQEPLVNERRAGSVISG